MAKYCRYCGKMLADNALFCSGCGKALGAPSFQEPKEAKKPGNRQERKRQEKEEKKRKKEQKRAEKKAKKKKALFGGINFLLVLTLLIETAVAGFMYPGYFVNNLGNVVEEVIARITKENGLTQEELVRELENSSLEDLEVIEYEITKESSPGNPLLIETTWSEEEITNAEAEVQDFTWENAEASVTTSNGTVRAEFNCWDLNEDDDALIVRTLGKKHDEASEMTLYGYDFSLASGQHEFTSHNIITIPRMSSDDRDSYVAYYNPDTGKYEYVYSEITEDGKNYRVYLDHFSTIAEVIPDYLKPSFYNSNIFYEPEYESVMPAMDRKIAFSHAGYVEWANKNAVDLVKLAESGICADDVTTAGLGLLDYLGLPGNIRDIGNAAKQAGTLDTITMYLGYTVIALKALNQACIDRDIRSFAKAFSKDKWSLMIDTIFTTFSFVGNKLATYGAVTAGASVAAIPVGILLCGISITYTTHGLLQLLMKTLGEPPIPDAYPGMDTYQKYLLYKSAIVRFDQDVWEVALSGLKIYDSASDTYIDSMYMMVRDIMLKYKNDPQMVNSALEQVTTQYTRYFYTGLSANERANFNAYLKLQYMKSLRPKRQQKYGDDFAELEKDRDLLESLKGNWQDPDNDTINEYTSMHMEYVQKNVNERVRAVERDEFIKTRLVFESVVQNKIVPMLNERIIFSVVDPSAKTFDQSELSAYQKGKNIQDYANDMWFMRGKIRTSNDIRLGHLLCMPSNRDKKDYTVESVQPYPRENSNVVYSCTRYHYMQMGAPDKLILHVNNYSDNVRIQIGELPKVGKNGVVDVELVLNPDLSYFTGVWIPMDFKERFDKGEDLSKEYVLALVYIEGENTFMEYEGPAWNYMNKDRWIYVKSFKYDAKTRELTINFRENGPNGIDTAVFFVDQNDHLIMTNRGGPFEFFRSKERY